MNGNREWASREATRRAAALDRPYAVYRRIADPDEYILRPQEVPAPDASLWRLVATYQL